MKIGTENDSTHSLSYELEHLHLSVSIFGSHKKNADKAAANEIMKNVEQK